MSNVFDTTWPIYCAAMNKVSDANLASAVWNAGCMPSLSLLNYIIDRKIDYKLMQQELDKFKNMSPLGKFVLSVNSSSFLNQEFYDWAIKNKLTHIEVIPDVLKLKGTEFEEKTELFFQEMYQASIKYKKHGIKLIFKSLTRFLIFELEKKFKGLFDAYILKGPEGAGTIVDRLDNNSLLQDQIAILNKHPDCVLITTGGISKSYDVKKYIDAGASYIGIGTLFAVSKECAISKETKQKILGKSIERFTDTNQNAIIFSKGIEEFDNNHTNSLTMGIQSPKNGHVFVGRAIESITEIKPVEQIVRELVNEI
jgi:hypothetical protein